MDGRVSRWVGGRMGGCVEGWVGEWVDGWKHSLESYSKLNSTKQWPWATHILFSAICSEGAEWVVCSLHSEQTPWPKSLWQEVAYTAG